VFKESHSIVAKQGVADVTQCWNSHICCLFIWLVSL